MSADANASRLSRRLSLESEQESAEADAPHRQRSHSGWHEQTTQQQTPPQQTQSQTQEAVLVRELSNMDVHASTEPQSPYSSATAMASV